MRAALVHGIFNVCGVLLWVGLIGQLAAITQFISPAYPARSGAVRLAAEVPRQTVNANTVFNFANTLLVIGFSTQFARLVHWLVPDRPPGEEALMVQAKYLDEELLSTPSLALN